jgi:poly-gamma-glutamate synthesis protein (capsule biosynthesis protein)
MNSQTRTNEMITLMGVGDVGSDWWRVEPPQDIYRLIKPVIRQADIAFAQQEGLWTETDDSHQDIVRTVHRQQRNYAPLLAECGFHVVSIASNHCFMYGPNEFITNIENHRKAGFAVVGGGKNIRQAREPAIIERKGIKVGFLAYVSVIDPKDAAGEDTVGVAPLRVRTFYEPTQDKVPGWPDVRVINIPYAEDVAAMVDDIKKLKERADIVVVSIHGGISDKRAVIGDYQITFAHTAIDAGADVILGHHAHILKGIEVYKGKVCFYGLCNFLQVGARERLLAGRHRIAKITKVADPGPEWELYVYHPEARMSMIAKCQISKSGIERFSFLPVAMNGRAQPRALKQSDPEFDKTVQYVRDITAEYFKTSFKVEGDEVVIS